MIENDLSQLYSRDEIKSFTSLLFEHLLGLSRLKVHLQQHDQIPDAKLTEFKEIIGRLKNYEPIQYILGETDFFGLQFKVNPTVLIPRPETEELVEWILKDSPDQNAQILDIGTGSGCIPVALAKNRQDLIIEGWDISEAALEIARENAATNKVRVQFSKADILRWREFSVIKKYDIIVSNPPYVTKSEESSMLKNVTENEPHLALFVPDEDPLIFFREIAAFAKVNLNSSGRIYFEINEKMGNMLVNLLESNNYLNIVVKKDINVRDRMISCCCEQ